MANLIKFKIGSTAPTALELGEPAFNIVDNKLYIGKGALASPVEVGGGGSTESYLPLSGGTIEGDLAIVVDSSGNGGNISAGNGGFETLGVSFSAYIDGNLEVVEDNTVPGGQVTADYFKGVGYSLFKNGSYKDLLEVVLDMVYPVGSIYISTNSTSPATLFGGTWEQLSDRYLVAAGSNYTAGTTGVGNFGTDAGIGAKGYGTTNSSPTYNGRVVTTASSSSTHNNSTSSTKTLANSGFTFDPPYLAVYMWKRTA